MVTSEIKEIFEHRATKDLPRPVKPVEMSCMDGRSLLYRAMQYVLSTIDKQPIWLPEYEEVATWLTNNERKGLILCGDTSSGKSLLVKYVLPSIVTFYVRKQEHRVAQIEAASGTKTDPLDIHTLGPQDIKLGKVQTLNKPRSIIFIDDVGLEPETRTEEGTTSLFSKIVENAEKQGSLLIMSTRLDGEQIVEKYGALTVHRLKSMTKIVECRSSVWGNI